MINCNLKKNWNNKKCKKAVGEGHFIMILPKADNSGNKIKQTYFNKYIDKVNDRFGGSTTKPITLGCWRDEKRKNKLQCETGFAIETWRDFDTPQFEKFNVEKRKKQLTSDFKFMNKLAEESAREFGQDSVPVIFDNITDAKLNKGLWKKKIEKSKLTGKKVKGDLWKKYI